MADVSFCSVLPPSHNSDDPNQNHLLLKVFVISSCIIGTGFLICITHRLFKIARRISPILFGNRENNHLGQNQELEIEQSSGLINAEGLQESVIDSITVIEFEAGASFMGGTDCSDCLCKFQEKQSLRLLPKCSHVFHEHCIDKWLRVVGNCPLCRAPILSGDGSVFPASSGDLSSIVSLE